jgi:hypothetical protein
MNGRQMIRNAAKGMAATAATGYAALVVFNRANYGNVKGCAERGKDSLCRRDILRP